MSTDRIAGQIVFFCDSCDQELETGEEDFHEAVQEKKNAGWRSVKVNDEWEDRCPDC